MHCAYPDMSLCEGAGTFLSLSPTKVGEILAEVGGLTCQPTCRALGSCGNRVFEAELTDGSRIVVRFYRPGRWSEQQIREEHRLITELHAAGVPVCAGRPFPDGEILKSFDLVFFALFDHHEGQVGQTLSDEEIDQLGQLVARMHRIAARTQLRTRSRIDPDQYIRQALAWFDLEGTVPPALKTRYFAAAEAIAEIADARFTDVEMIPVHGDLHPGNMLRHNGELRLLDFDEMGTGPAVQDFWLTLRSRDSETQRRREIFLAGYQQVRPFHRSSLGLIEILRGMRMVHYAGWRARCWYDPAFRAGWPAFRTAKYWNRLTIALENQLWVIRWELQRNQAA